MRYSLPELEMYLVDSLPGFSCKRCARCCQEKLIPLYARDLERLEALNGQFCSKTSAAERRLTGAAYKMRMRNGKCIFLDDTSCLHYDLRPATCRRHPFLVTGKHLLVSSTCPGIDWSFTQPASDAKGLSAEISLQIDAVLGDYLRRRPPGSSMPL